MGNDDSRGIQDTRGRPRDEDVVHKVEKIEKAYMDDALPITFFLFEGQTASKKEAKRLRNSTALRELEEELGIRFRLLARHDGVVVCLGKGK